MLFTLAHSIFATRLRYLRYLLLFFSMLGWLPFLCRHGEYAAFHAFHADAFSSFEGGFSAASFLLSLILPFFIPSFLLPPSHVSLSRG